MTTKMKGLFKGLRYISQIFEEEKEEEIQIGFPTDVKHVAHIGWDGPSATVDSSPSWMKEFKSTTGGFQSAPLDCNGNNREDPEIKWVSEDSKKGNRSTTNSSGRDLPEVPRSSRKNNSNDNNNNNNNNNNANDSPKKKDSSTKSRQSRRNHSKDSSEGSVKSNRPPSGELGLGPSDSPPPDPSKKTRRKKPKELDGGGSTRSRSKDSDGGSTRSRTKDSDGGSTRSRSKATANGGGSTAYSDPGAPGFQDEEKERR